MKPLGKNKNGWSEFEVFGHIIHIGGGSSTHHPEKKGGMSTSDMKMWYKLDNFDWFQPYGGFRMTQIMQMINVCNNEHQLISLMELLSAKKQEI